MEQIAGSGLGALENSQEGLARACKVNGLLLSKHQLGLLQSYVDLLVDWNSKVNLISRNDIGNVWFRHILHSLSILLLIAVPRNLRVLDMGSGGGLPGLPVAIARKDLKIVLLDSIRKKVAAVKNIVSMLGLRNAAVIGGRAEDIASHGQEGFNLVVARAVGPLADLVDWSSRLVRKPSSRNVLHTKGSSLSPKQSFHLPCLLALKGGDIEHEVSIAKKRRRGLRITSIDLALEEGHKYGLGDKKIVVVEL